MRRRLVAACWRTIKTKHERPTVEEQAEAIKIAEAVYNKKAQLLMMEERDGAWWGKFILGGPHD